MRRVLFILGALILLVAMLWVAGALIPREHRAASQVVLNQPIDSVWNVVRNPGALMGTWPELTGTEQLPPDAEGRERWRMTVDGFDMTLVVAEAAAPERLVTQVESPPGSAFGGHWVYQLESGVNGTTVTAAEEGWIGPAPFRLMARIMGYHRSIDQYLTALGRHFGETPVPRHIP